MDNPNFPDDAVPCDFPHANKLGAVSGAAPKILLQRTEEGTFVQPKASDHERYLRWMYCEDLANQLAKAALASKRGKRSQMSEVEILEQYLPRLREKKWTNNDEESKWILRRVALLLNWPLPRFLNLMEE